MRDVCSADGGGLGQLYLDFFLNEVLAARHYGEAYELWIVSPWITPVTFAMAGRGRYPDLFGSRSTITLGDVIQTVTRFQGRVRLCARPGDGRSGVGQSVVVTQRLLEKLQAVTVSGLEVGWVPDLHAKMYVGQVGALVGSPNLTHYGVHVNREFLTYYREADRIGSLRTVCEKFWAVRQ